MIVGRASRALAPVPMQRLTTSPKPQRGHGRLANNPVAVLAKPDAPPPHACDAAKHLDRFIEQGLHLAPRVPSLPKVAEALAEQRRKTVGRLVQRLAPVVAQLAPGIEARDPGAIGDYEALMAAAVQSLRHDRDGSLRDVLVAIDNQTYHPGTELSDDSDMPMDKRLAILDTLHRFNVATYSYERWGDKLLPWLTGQPDGKPLSIVDLAAGTGGFAVALKQRFGAHVAVTATDLVDAFLTLGQMQAQKTHTDVAFAHQDVLDLRPLRARGVDVFTCTQSLHHFTPGQLGRMIGEARASARRGLYFVDGERGMLVTALVTLSMALYGRDYPVVHDTFVSLRRMYVAEEIELLARLAPGLQPEDTVEAGRLAPGHLFLRVSRGQAKGKLP